MAAGDFGTAVAQAIKPTVDAVQVGRLSEAAISARALLTATLPSVGVIGDSITTTMSSYPSSYWRMGCAMAGDRFIYTREYATPGATIAASAATNLAPLLAGMGSGPGAVLIALGTNNMAGGGATTIAATMAELEAVVATIVAAGKTPILWTPPPRGDTEAISVITKGAEYSMRVRHYAITNGYEVLDCNRLLVDPTTGYYDAAYWEAGDPVHPNMAGHSILADALAVILRRLFPTPIPNPLTSPVGPDMTAAIGLFAVDSNADGKADGVSSYGAAAGFSLEAFAGGVGQYQVQTWDGVTSPGVLRIELSGFVPGHVYAMSLDYAGTFVGGDGSQKLAQIRYLYMTWRNAGGSKTGVGQFGAGGTNIGIGYGHPDLTEAHMRYQLITCPADRSLMRIDFTGVGTLPDEYVMKLAQFSIIDMTDLGLT